MLKSFCVGAGDSIFGDCCSPQHSVHPVKYRFVLQSDCASAGAPVGSARDHLVPSPHAGARGTQGEYKELTKWWKQELEGDVQGVKVSKRLHNTPLVVVTSKFGWSANMERIMKAQVPSTSQ